LALAVGGLATEPDPRRQRCAALDQRLRQGVSILFLLSFLEE